MKNEATHSYSINDIRRYLQGKMAMDEMHALEKAALADPFLSDAIEGYSQGSLEEAAEQLAVIERRLTGDTPVKRLPLFHISAHTFRVAAAVLVAAALGGITLVLVDGLRTKNTLAASKPSIKQESVSAGASRSPTAMDTAPLMKMDRRAQKPAPSLPKKKSQPQSTLTTEPATPTLPLRSLAFSSKRAGQTAATGTIEYSGKVLDINNQPVPGAAIRLQDNQQVAIADFNGHFDFKSADTLVHVIISAIGFEQTVFEMSSRDSNLLHLKIQPLPAPSVHGDSVIEPHP